MRQSGFAGLPVVILIVVLIFAAFVYVIVTSERVLPGNNYNPVSSNPSTNNQSAGGIKPIVGEQILMSKFSKSLSELELYNLASTATSKGWVKVGNSYYVSGSGGLVEFDAISGKVMRFNDADKRYCDSNLVVLNNNLYISCRTASIMRYWNNSLSDAPGFELMKVDLESGKLVKSYAMNNDPNSKYNHVLNQDGDIIWISTFGGVAKLDTKTDKVNFYSKELGIAGEQTQVVFTLVDKDYVWFYVPASDKSVGGVSLYEKKSGKFMGFGPRELKKRKDRFDLDGWRLVDGGLEIGFSDYASDTTSTMVVKKYSYQTGKWEGVQQLSYDDWMNSLQKIYRRSYIPEFSKVDENNLGQLYNKEKDSIEVNNFDGREPLAISPVIKNRRFVLTRSSVDMIDQSLSFPQIFIKLGKQSVGNIASASPDLPWFFDPENEKSIFVSTECGQGCTNTTVWYFDLKNGKILGQKVKEYDFKNQNNSFLTEIQKKLMMGIENENYVIKNEESNKELIKINKNSGEIVFLNL